MKKMQHKKEKLIIAGAILVLGASLALVLVEPQVNHEKVISHSTSRRIGDKQPRSLITKTMESNQLSKRNHFANELISQRKSFLARQNHEIDALSDLRAPNLRTTVLGLL